MMTRTAWFGLFLALTLVLGVGFVAACGDDDDDGDDDNDDNDTADDDDDATDDDDTTDDDATDDDTDDDDDTGNAFNDDFDDYDLGSPPPDPWEVYTTGGGEITIVDSKDGSGRWVHIAQTNPGNAALALQHEFSVSGVVTWEFDLLFGPTTSAFYFTLGALADGCVPFVRAYVSQTMDVPAVFALGSGEQVKCANWTADGWATLKIAADFDAHTFAVLVDDAETACASMPFEGAVFNCMHCYAQPDSIADVDLDNLHLSGAPPEK